MSYVGLDLLVQSKSMEEDMGDFLLILTPEAMRSGMNVAAIAAHTTECDT